MKKRLDKRDRENIKLMLTELKRLVSDIDFCEQHIEICYSLENIMMLSRLQVRTSTLKADIDRLTRYLMEEK